MKKIIAILITVCTILLLSACEKAQPILEKESLPISGHFNVKDNIIIETDSFYKRPIKNARAYIYKDKQFYKLERHETEITIPKKCTIYGDVYGKDAVLPIQYYIYNNTVYAYFNADENKTSTSVTNFISIPQNDEYVILDDMYYKPTLINVKSGKTELIVQSDKISATVTCVSCDGKYAGVLGTKIGEAAPKSFILNLDNFKLKEIDIKLGTNDKLISAYPQLFLNNGKNQALYINCDYQRNNGEKVATSYYYYIDNEKTEEAKEPTNGYLYNENSPHIKMKYDNISSTFKVQNLEKNTVYSFSVLPSTNIEGEVNWSGEYFIGTVFNQSENVLHNGKTYAAYDMKNQKPIYINKADSKFDYTTYDGIESRYSWITDKELIVFCFDGTNHYIKTVIDLEDALK